VKLHRAAQVVPLLGICLASSAAQADYVNPKKVIRVSTDTRWLVDAAKTGVESGVESVTKSMLTNVGKSMLASYSPQLAALIFGEQDALEQHTQRIVAEIRETHADLAQRHRELLDEVMVQYRVDVIASIRSGANALGTFLAEPDLLRRINKKGMIEQLSQELDFTRTKLEEYAQTAATNPRIRFKRLELMPLHITAAQLAITASEHYQAIVAVETAFQRTGLSSSAFDDWVHSLTPAQVSAIEAGAPAFHHFRDRVMTEVIAVYEGLAAMDPVADFRDDIFTPPVSHNVVFTGNPNRFDVGSVTGSESNWSAPDGGSCGFPNNCAGGALLDGLRWYYYVNIPEQPGAACLEGPAYHDLIESQYVPWVEKADDPAASDCDRFWILDPALTGSVAEPGQYLASLDGYTMWFNDGNDAYDLHRELIHGDLVRVVYGPIGLILDRFHEELHGSQRPRNDWDLLIEEYDRLVGLLGSGESYDVAVAADADLRQWRATIEVVGLADWFEMLEKYVERRDTAQTALTLIQGFRTALDYMHPPDAPMSAADLRLALSADWNAYASLVQSGNSGGTQAALAARIGNEAVAKLAAVVF
jgi:hypothetical protein